jgi:hypothetical protein
MRSVVSRLARLEQLNRLRTGPQRIRIERGYLKQLPDDTPCRGTPSRCDGYRQGQVLIPTKIGTSGRNGPALSRSPRLPAPLTRS